MIQAFRQTLGHESNIEPALKHVQRDIAEKWFWFNAIQSFKLFKMSKKIVRHYLFIQIIHIQ